MNLFFESERVGERDALLFWSIFFCASRFEPRPGAHSELACPPNRETSSPSLNFYLPCRRKGPPEAAGATGPGRMFLQPKPSSSSSSSSSLPLPLLPPGLPPLLLRSDRPPGRPRAGRTRSLPSLSRRGERQEREGDARLHREGAKERKGKRKGENISD